MSLDGLSLTAILHAAIIALMALGGHACLTVAEIIVHANAAQKERRYVPHLPLHVMRVLAFLLQLLQQQLQPLLQLYRPTAWTGALSLGITMRYALAQQPALIVKQPAIAIGLQKGILHMSLGIPHGVMFAMATLANLIIVVRITKDAKMRYVFHIHHAQIHAMH